MADKLAGGGGDLSRRQLPGAAAAGHGDGPPARDIVGGGDARRPKKSSDPPFSVLDVEIRRAMKELQVPGSGGRIDPRLQPMSLADPTQQLRPPPSGRSRSTTKRSGR